MRVCEVHAWVKGVHESHTCIQDTRTSTCTCNATHPTHTQLTHPQPTHTHTHTPWSFMLSMMVISLFNLAMDSLSFPFDMKSGLNPGIMPWKWSGGERHRRRETREERDTGGERHGRRETREERDTGGERHGRRETQEERHRRRETREERDTGGERHGRRHGRRETQERDTGERHRRETQEETQQCLRACGATPRPYSTAYFNHTTACV